MPQSDAEHHRQISSDDPEIEMLQMRHVSGNPASRHGGWRRGTAFIQSHLLADDSELVADTGTGGTIPKRGVLLTQSQYSSGPGLAPASFDGPRAPAEIARTGPRFPT